MNSPRIIAITGTNGKTTTTRLIAFLLSHAGKKTGFTCSDGIYLNGKIIYEGDCSGPRSARELLESGEMDIAVLEVARGGLIREGLGYNQCDIAIVTNITGDHLGTKGINNLKQLTDLKSRVPFSLCRSGVAILNLDDPECRKLGRRIRNKIIFFTSDPNHPMKSTILKNGNELVQLNSAGNIEYMNKQASFDVEHIKNIPLTLEGRAGFMTENSMAAVAAAIASGISIEQIRLGLNSFFPSTENTPGRLNFFSFPNCTVITDYVHNVPGYIQISKFLREYKNYKTGIFAAPGDRRDEDIRGIGKIAAEIFDEIIIRIDYDTRNRTKDEIVNLLSEGVRTYDPLKKMNIILNTNDALDHAINNIPKGGIVFLSAADVKGAINYIKEKQSSYKLTV